MLSKFLSRNAVEGCCPRCSGSFLPWCCPGCCPAVLSRVLRITFAIGRCQGAVQVSRVRIMFAIGRCQGAVQGAVQGCCPGCSGSCLPLGGVNVLSRVLSGVLFRVLRIMFAIGRCQGVVQGGVQGCCSRCSGSCLPLGCQGAVQGAVQGAFQGAPDHVCHWAVSGCCPGCCAGVLSRVLRIMFAIGRCQGAVQGAVQGAPDHVCHWAVSGCCPGCCPAVSGCCPGCCARDKRSKAEPEFNVLISIWGLCWCNFVSVFLVTTHQKTTAKAPKDSNYSLNPQEKQKTPTNTKKHFKKPIKNNIIPPKTSPKPPKLYQRPQNNHPRHHCFLDEGESTTTGTLPCGNSCLWSIPCTNPIMLIRPPIYTPLVRPATASQVS